MAYDFQTKLVIRRSVNFLFQELENAKIRGKKWSKQLPLLKKVVESAFLLTYVPGVDFEQLICKGYYNDITATALYALVLDYLHIPYAIKLEEHQVYPVIDPDGAKISITIPNNLLPTKSNSVAFAKQYIELLEDMKMLKNGEASMNSVESLFQRYYFPQEQYIALDQLPGVVYFHAALAHYQKEEYHLALAKLDLAHQVLPMPRHQPFRIACLFQLAAQFDPEDSNTFEDLFQLYDLHPVPLVEEEILALFIGISENQLFTLGQIDQFEKSYALFLKEAKADSQLEQKIHKVYLFQKAKFYANNSDYDKVYMLADSIFEKTQKMKTCKRFFLDCLKAIFSMEGTLKKDWNRSILIVKSIPI